MASMLLSPFAPPSPSSLLPVSTNICSLCLHLHCCPVNRFIALRLLVEGNKVLWRGALVYTTLLGNTRQFVSLHWVNAHSSFYQLNYWPPWGERIKLHGGRTRADFLNVSFYVSKLK